MTKNELIAFMRAQRWAVEASVSSAGAPQAAVIGVVITDDLEIVFDTETVSRKAKNLRADPRIALVIGWDESKTVQYEGLVDEPAGAERETLLAQYFSKFPDGVERAARVGITYFRARPMWIRYSDFSTAVAAIEEIDPATLEF
jgi:pyridoxine/pyridoxamine 5'-phosphate oxidase